MKLLTSFCLLFLIFKAQASAINIFHESEPDRAKVVKGIFTGTYFIPEELIGLVNVGHCDAIKRTGMLELCIKKNGDLLVVSVDRGFITESLKIFHAP